jgi:hypothetical protein
MERNGLSELWREDSGAAISRLLELRAQRREIR